MKELSPLSAGLLTVAVFPGRKLRVRPSACPL